MLDHPFVPQQLASAGGGGGIRCGAPNSIGNVPSSALRPERGVDEELSYAHGFGGDAFAQLALYDVNVYDKLYSTIVPLASTGGGFIDAAFLAQQEQAIAAPARRKTRPRSPASRGRSTSGRCARAGSPSPARRGSTAARASTTPGRSTRPC